MSELDGTIESDDDTNIIIEEEVESMIVVEALDVVIVALDELDVVVIMTTGATYAAYGTAFRYRVPRLSTPVMYTVPA